MYMLFLQKKRTLIINLYYNAIILLLNWYQRSSYFFIKKNTYKPDIFSVLIYSDYLFLSYNKLQYFLKLYFNGSILSN